MFSMNVGGFGLSSELPADFSNEYYDSIVRVETSIGVVIEGRLLASSKYWFKIKTSDGVVYINKAHIITVRVIEGVRALKTRSSKQSKLENSNVS